jgi:hypothetical protein
MKLILVVFGITILLVVVWMVLWIIGTKEKT